MKYLFTLFGIAVGLTLGYAFFNSPVTTLTSTPNTSESKSIARLESDLIAIRKEMARLQTTQSQVSMNYRADNVTATESTIAPQPHKDSVPTLTTAIHNYSNKAYETTESSPNKSTSIVASLEYRLTSEDPDNHWEVSMESELANNLQSENLVNTSLSSVECHTSLCRVVLHHTDSEAEDIFMTIIPDLPGMQDTELFYTRTELADGSTDMSLYVARQGQVLGLAEAGL